MATIVNLEAKKAETADALERLTALVQDDLNAVNKTIIERMDSPIALIPQLAGHIVAAGGKRLRPVLTLAAAKLCNYPGDRQIKLATCVEFIHTATLLHDDVVDESGIRRGQDSANTIWGNQASVLVGDFLFSRAFELMVEDGSLEVLAILSRASSIISEGEVHQLMTANDTETSEEAYLEVIKSKTAELFAAAARIGAVVAVRPKAEEDALEVYGRNLGVAFQLIDDALDYSAEQAKLGKAVGDDFRDGKITLPVILAFRRGTDDERAFWRRCLEEQDIQDGDLEQAIGLMTKYGTLNDTVERARHFGDVARDALQLFPDSEIREACLDVIEFCISRAY